MSSKTSTPKQKSSSSNGGSASKKKTPSSSSKSSSSTSTARPSSSAAAAATRKTEESQCLLRLPKELAQKVTAILQQHDQAENSSKTIDLDIDIAFGDSPDILEFLKEAIKHPATEPDEEDGYISDVEYQLERNRRGRFRFKDEVYPAELWNLPCVIEAYKTLDNQTYYKAADLAQMILVKTPEQMTQEMRQAKLADTQRSANKKKKTKKRFLTTYPHGITPSTKNILHHWDTREIEVTKKDIADMVDQFMQLMQEEDPENVSIEILEDNGEQLPEEVQESEDEDTESDTDSSDSDNDEEEMVSAMLGNQNSNPPMSVSTPPQKAIIDENSNMSDSMSGSDTESVSSINFATAMQQTKLNPATPPISTPPSVSGLSTADDTHSMATSDQSDDEFVSVDMDNNNMEDEDVDILGDSVGESVSRIDSPTPLQNTMHKQQLFIQRNSLMNEISEITRTINDTQSKITSAPNRMIRDRFNAQIQEKQNELSQKQQELSRIEEEINM